MNLVVIGPPTSGKTIQAEIIAGQLGLCYICPEDLLENAEGDLREEIEEHKVIDRDIPDELVISVLKEKILSSEGAKGVVLDGFPTTAEQAEELDKFVKIDRVIILSISDEESIDRVSNNLYCKECGMSYNQKETPPKDEFICDVCGNELVRKERDFLEEVKKRLDFYHEETEAVGEKYDVIRIDGKKDIDEISEEILEELM